jgi:hypothetical protein
MEKGREKILGAYLVEAEEEGVIVVIGWLSRKFLVGL